MKLKPTHVVRSIRFFLFFAILLFGKNVSAAKFYVSASSGNDTLNGQYPTFSTGYDGPKQTIMAAYLLAGVGDTIAVASGYYDEIVYFDKDIYFEVDSITIRKIIVDGFGIKVNLSGNTLNVRDTLEMLNGFIVSRGSSVKFRLIPDCTQLGGSVDAFVDGNYQVGVGSGPRIATFLSGIGADYRPVTLNFIKPSNDTLYLTGSVDIGPAPVSGGLPSGIKWASKVHHWWFGASQWPSAFGFTTKLDYDSVSNDDEVLETSKLRVLAADLNGNWQDLTGFGSANRKGNITNITPIDTLGYFTLGNATGGTNALGWRYPVARMTFTAACTGLQSQFTDKTFAYKAPVKKWYWDFGVISSTTDTSTQQNPKYAYTLPGLYQVMLVAENIFGNTDTTYRTIDIRPNPVVNFTATNVCIGLSNSFNDASTVASPDAIAGRNWSFGDGATSTAASPTRTYAASGTYNVKLIVTSTAGCKDSTVKAVNVWQKPSPSFTAPSNCISDSSVFWRNPSTSPPDNTITYLWKVDGVNVSNDTLKKIKFTVSGIHSATLYATTNRGCKDSASSSFTIYGLPKLGFALATIPSNTAVQCLNGNKFSLTPTLITTEGQNILQAGWSWGDGTNSILTDTSHSYTAENSYLVKLRAITDLGCADSISATYTVKGRLSLNFGKTGFCVPDTIRFQDSATVSSSAVIARQWFLNGVYQTANNPASITINGTGPHIIKYWVANSDGCIDSVSKTYSFTSYPTLTYTSLGTQPFCPGDSFTLTVNGGDSAKWLMDNDTTRKRVFKSAGSYTVRVYNSAACYVTDSDTIRMHPAANIIAFNDTTIVRGGVATLRVKGGVSYSWSPMTALVPVSGNTMKAGPVKTQRYAVTGTDANNCKGVDTVTVTVVDPLFVKIPNIITPNGDNQNDAWDLRQLADLNLYDLSITDYNGKLVYESNNYLNDWKAQDKNSNDLPDGIYYYLLRNRSNNSELKGFIQVIR